MKTDWLIKGNTYYISHLADIHEINHYKGDGVYTGKITKMDSQEKGSTLYFFEFRLPDGNFANFPIHSIFEPQEHTSEDGIKVDSDVSYINGYCFGTGFWSDKPIKPIKSPVSSLSTA